jgi:hypothetical protein
MNKFIITWVATNEFGGTSFGNTDYATDDIYPNKYHFESQTMKAFNYKSITMLNIIPLNDEQYKEYYR